jgi:hypothetical protein
MESIYGIIATEPSQAVVQYNPQDGKGRQTFLFATESDNRQISCMSSARFSGTVPRAGTRVRLDGGPMSNQVTSGVQMPVFIFDELSVAV